MSGNDDVYNCLLICQIAIAGLLESIVLKFLSFVSKNLIVAIPVMMVLGLVILGDIWLRLSLDDLDNQRHIA